jgi:hypothetical protein
MKNWFSKSISKSVEKSIPELIQEIHTSFETEVDSLLEFSKEILPVVTDKSDLIDKHNRLSRVGFTNTNEGKIANQELERLSQIEVENKKKQVLHEAINYFAFTYPQYKFITEESVNKLCQKYGLVFGEVSYYIGDVPEKNLLQIENFKIKPEDECWELHTYSMYERDEVMYCGETYCKREKNSFYIRNAYESSYVMTKLSDLKIVASLKDFDTSRMELKGYELKAIPDPVVIKPVIYKNNRYFLVVTAWGLESSDEDVVNERSN